MIKPCGRASAVRQLRPPQPALRRRVILNHLCCLGNDGQKLVQTSFSVDDSHADRG